MMEFGKDAAKVSYNYTLGFLYDYLLSPLGQKIYQLVFGTNAYQMLQAVAQNDYNLAYRLWGQIEEPSAMVNGDTLIHAFCKILPTDFNPLFLVMLTNISVMFRLNPNQLDNEGKPALFYLIEKVKDHQKSQQAYAAEQYCEKLDILLACWLAFKVYIPGASQDTENPYHDHQCQLYWVIDDRRSSYDIVQHIQSLMDMVKLPSNQELARIDQQIVSALDLKHTLESNSGASQGKLDKLTELIRKALNLRLTVYSESGLFKRSINEIDKSHRQDYHQLGRVLQKLPEQEQKAVYQEDLDKCVSDLVVNALAGATAELEREAQMDAFQSVVKKLNKTAKEKEIALDRAAYSVVIPAMQEGIAEAMLEITTETACTLADTIVPHAIESATNQVIKESTIATEADTETPTPETKSWSMYSLFH